MFIGNIGIQENEQQHNDALDLSNSAIASGNYS